MEEYEKADRTEQVAINMQPWQSHLSSEMQLLRHREENV